MTFLVVRTEWDERSPAEQELYERERRRHRSACGPATTYVVESLVVGASVGLGLEPDDVVVELVDEGRRVMVHPPAVVLSAAHPVRGTRGKTMHLLRRRLDLEPIPLGMVMASFRASRLRSATPLAEGPVGSPQVRRALLDLWALDHAE